MLKDLPGKLQRAPLTWIGFGLGLLVFALTRLSPATDWVRPPGEQAVLDQGVVLRLQQDPGAYELIDGKPQTYGAHVLPQYLRTLVSRATGDSGRAGVWLSVLGVVATFGGMYALARRVLPLRGFCMATLVALGGLGTLHYAVSPDPAVALGMALVVWGMAYFLSALERRLPHRVFLSGLMFGLAGYIRFELGVLWVLLAAHLISLMFYDNPARRKGLPLTAMALGGLLTVALVMWPMLSRNLILSGAPVLPGYDADLILGAPAALGGGGPPFGPRFWRGLRVLMFDQAGAGIFAGLMWPVGMVVSLVALRDKRVVFNWIPFLLGVLALLTVMSFVTGPGSFEECLRVIGPLLLPFAVLPVGYVVFRWLQDRPRGATAATRAWCLAGLGVYLMVQLPHLFPREFEGRLRQANEREALVEDFAAQPESLLARPVLTDRPGGLLAAGKTGVYGLNGETDWRILTSKFADGSPRPGLLLEYLRENRITLVHLSNPDDPLVDLLAMRENAPEFREVEGFTTPHKVFRVVWP